MYYFFFLKGIVAFLCNLPQQWFVVPRCSQPAEVLHSCNTRKDVEGQKRSTLKRPSLQRLEKVFGDVDGA